jgi:hypothetical protein
METQATAPAQAQVQTPVHPIHEEQATVNALTQWVQENPDNDPHEGTDLEAPKEVAQEQEAQPKEEAEEGTKLELPEDDPLFEIEYKTETGKETKKLSLKELREGYLAKQDYHRNIQKVKAEQADLANKAREAETRAAQNYVQQLETQKQLLIRAVAPELQNVDLNKLAMEDPAEAQRLFFRQIQLNQAMQSITQEQQTAQQKVQEQMQSAHRERMQKAQETLASEIPGWGDEVQRNLTKTAVEDYGFKAEELAQVADARVIKLIHDAHQYRQLQKAKPGIDKKVVSLPKVIKPGSAEKPNPAQEQASRARERLKKTGSIDDAAQAYLSRQQKK